MTTFVPYAQRGGYLLNGVPGPHMRRLSARAKRENTSIANVVSTILSERCAIPFEPSPRPFLVAGESEQLSLRLPLAVLDCIRAEAEKRGVTMRTVILDGLSDSLKLKAPPPTTVGPNRPGRPRQK